MVEGITSVLIKKHLVCMGIFTVIRTQNAKLHPNELKLSPKILRIPSMWTIYPIQNINVINFSKIDQIMEKSFKNSIWR